jgi:hypothetical protein
MAQNDRKTSLREMIAGEIGRYERHRAAAADLLTQAACTGTHPCGDDCTTDNCQCDMVCDCMDADEARETAAIEQGLAQAASLAANTLALLLVHDCQP